MPVLRMREAANCSVTGITHIFRNDFRMFSAVNIVQHPHKVKYSDNKAKKK